MAIKQKHRLFAVSSPLGEDVLVFWRMHASEQLGRLFEYRLELLSEDDTLRLEDLLGKNMTVRLELPEGETRYFNGFASDFAHAGVAGRYAVYKTTLRPWFWFLTRTADCRIFQAEKVPDIVKKIFREHGFTDFEERLSKDYRQWEYCVQYRETDFNFISRLFEQEGIYYYFKHENGKHKLIMADSYGAHETIPNYAEVPYYPPDIHDHRARDHVYEWVISRQVQPGAVALNDFNFKTTRSNLRTLSNRQRPHAQAEHEIYDYPGEYEQSGDGDNYAGIRLEELQAQHEIAQARGNAYGLTTGALFTLSDYPRADQNREYLITAASYELASVEYESLRQAAPGQEYEIRFAAMPAREPYRAPRLTPKPVVQGPQTAIVVGKAGEEIWTDQFGRVKCQFHWDRYGRADENSSCWIRVAQLWAGKQWGAMYIPRIGQEVIVDFLEGDPDRPIVTGRVYNDVNMPPYNLPGKATVSTVKSNSSKGGGGFNEIRIEDRKGSEQIFIHAERNQDNRVKRDAFEWIGRQRHLIVKDDQYEEVKGDKHGTVGGDHNQKIKGTRSLDVSMDQQEKVGMKHALDAGMEIHLKAGMNVVIEANMSITLKAGGGFIVVGPTGVTISGTPVLINSGGSAGSGSGASPDAAKLPQEADTATAGQVDSATARPITAAGGSGVDVVTASDYQKPPQSTITPPPLQPSPGSYQNPQAQALAAAAQTGTPFCERCAAGS